MYQKYSIQKHQLKNNNFYIIMFLALIDNYYFDVLTSLCTTPRKKECV